MIANKNTSEWSLFRFVDHRGNGNSSSHAPTALPSARACVRQGAVGLSSGGHVGGENLVGVAVESVPGPVVPHRAHAVRAELARHEAPAEGAELVEHLTAAPDRDA
jgi:hypothetical protein